MALKQIQARYSDRQFQAWTNTEGGGFFTAAKSLFALDAFGVVVNTMPWASADGNKYQKNMQPLVVESYELSRKHSWLTVDLSESGKSSTRETNLSVSAGLRKQGFFCGINIYSGSPASTDRLLRAALFKRAIEALGLKSSVSVFIEKENLRMESVAPWILQYPSADIKGHNPSGFNVCGFPSIDEALSVLSHLIDALEKTVVCTRYIGQFDANGYQQAMPRLNALWSGWYLEVVGALSEKALSVLKGGELDDTTSFRIPAFRWWEQKSGPQIFGCVVIENGRRHLELATDSSEPKILEERIAFLGDMDFTPVLP